MSRFEPIGSQLSATWLKTVGLRWNPFEYGEASGDERLGDYVVGHEAFSVAWTDTPAMVFAPAGGGKTAMRLYTAQLCWRSLGPAHPLPVFYIPTLHLPRLTVPDAHEHARWLADACARTLLVAMAWRPTNFLTLGMEDRARIVGVLQAASRRNLLIDVQRLQEGRDLAGWTRRIVPAYRPSDPPNPNVLGHWCLAMLGGFGEATGRATPAQTSAHELLDALLTIAHGLIGPRSIYIMVDGLDATHETMTDPHVAVQWLDWLLDRCEAWRQQGVVLKCYLPQEVEQALDDHLSGKREIASTLIRAHLTWTPELLAELIRRRIYIASEGKYGSLDAIAEPSLSDIELSLAKIARPLPRDVIRLADRVLHEMARRTHDEPGALSDVEIQAARDWYWQQQAAHTPASVN